jgi:diketogulonate reductase-like aldo/keto reductase
MFCLNVLRTLQGDGLIASIGLCNFDSIRTDEICMKLGPGVITTNQVQVLRLAILANLNPDLAVIVFPH